MRLRTPLVLLASVAVVILLACSQSDTPRLPEADFFVGQGSPFLLRLGESVGVQTPSSFVIVQVSDVLGDSRCPVDVTCVDAGNVTIRLAVQTALAIREVDIDVPPDGDVQIVIEEVTVEVLAVRPAAMEGMLIDVLDYEVAMRVIQTGDIGISQ